MPTSFSADKFYNETMAKAFLQFYEHTAQVVWNQFMEATWNYVTNITKKNREEMVWYHLNFSPFSPCSSQGSGGGWEEMGEPYLLPLSRARGRRESPKYMSKQAASSGPLAGPRSGLGKNLLFLSPCKYYLLAFKDPGSFPSPS